MRRIVKKLTPHKLGSFWQLDDGSSVKGYDKQNIKIGDKVTVWFDESHQTAKIARVYAGQETQRGQGEG